MFTAVLIAAFSCGADPAPKFTGVNKMPAFTGVNKIASPVPGDPYGYASYDDFYRAVASGIKGVLVVGIEDRYVQSYTAHCRVPSGSYGLADGEYDCYPLNGVPQIVPRKGVSPKATGKSVGLPTTDAPNAAISRHPAAETSPSSASRPRVIYTVAPGAVPWGNTDCASPVG